MLPAFQFVDAAGGKREIFATENLERAALELRSQGLTVVCEVLHGPLDAALTSICERVDAKLLVVGDGANRSRPLLGTPVERLAGSVTVPMVVIRSARPFDAWALGRGPLRLLLAIDHSWSSALARNWLAQLAEYGSLNVVATHVWSPETEFSRRGLSSSPREEDRLELARELRAETEAALEGLPFNVSHRVRLELGGGRHLAEQLIEVAAHERVDLVVLGTHQRPKGLLGFLHSVSHEVLANAMMSIAFVPERSGPQTARHVELLTSRPLQPSREVRPFHGSE